MRNNDISDLVINNFQKLSNEFESLNIDSIFIEKNGKLDKIFYKDENLHELRSCSKLIVAMAVGIAIDYKMKINGQSINLDTKVYPILEKVANITNVDNISKIREWTLKNLLTHTTGYDRQMFSEKYIGNLDKNNILDYALNYEIPHDVGTRYAYNNVEPFLISILFEEGFGINLSDFVKDNIFDKLKITEYKWDNFGKYCIGASGLYMKHSDFHKIAQLILNNGKYDNEQIVPEYWITEMTSLQIETPNMYKKDRVFPKVGAGYFCFISENGYVFRDASNGQYIILNKEKNMLITIMATEENIKNVTEIFRGII